MDPTQFYENRIKFVNDQKAAGGTPYPHKFDTNITIPEFVQQFSSLEPGVRRTELTSALAGRIMSKRASGGKLLFYDLRADGQKVQLEGASCDKLRDGGTHTLQITVECEPVVII